MIKDLGRSGAEAPSGSRPTDGAASVSTADAASIPNAAPACRECGQPSLNGDPCETCAEVERILSMSDDEIIAESSDEELGWARGFKEGLRVGTMASAIIRKTALGEAAAIADVWADTKPNLENSTNPGAARAFATVASHTGETIAAAIRALASGIAARSDETRSGSAEGKSPVGEAETPPDSIPSSQSGEA